MMRHTQNNYRPDIDGLRAIAILSVVAYHAEIPGIPGGFIGVDVFFVLSGYLITGIVVSELLSTGTISLTSFYARRIRRLFPALFVVVVATCALGYFALLPIFDQQQDLARSGIATALYVSNFYFWLTTPGYFDQSTDFKPLLHTWSLSVEEQFYLLWPPLLLVTSRLARRLNWDVRRLLLTLSIIIFVASLLLCVSITQRSPTAAFYLSPARIWELAAGSMLAIALPNFRLTSAYLGTILSFTGVSAILFSVLTFGPQTVFPGHSALLPVFGTAAAIAGGQISENPIQRILARSPLVFLGLLSYSWYLWHWPLLALSRAYWAAPLDITGRLVLISLSLFIAYLSYRLIESPIRFGRPGPFAQTKTTILAGVILTLAMCLPTGALGAWAKYIGRHSPTLSRFAAAHEDRPLLRQACHQSPPYSTLSAASSCTAGDPNQSPVVVLWGDSHADQLSPLVQLFADQTPNVSILVRSFTGCTPVGPVQGAYSTIVDACRRFNADVLREIQTYAADRLRGVILSSRWLRLFDMPELHHVEPDRRVRGNSKKALQAENDLRDLVAQLNALGLRVLVVAPVPEMPADVPSCLARRAILACSASRSLTDIQRADVLHHFYGIKSGNVDLGVFDPIESICDSNWCFAERDRVITYIDDNHLTASGSRRLLHHAEPALVWTVARK